MALIKQAIFCANVLLVIVLVQGTSNNGNSTKELTANVAKNVTISSPIIPSEGKTHETKPPVDVTQLNVHKGREGSYLPTTLQDKLNATTAKAPAILPQPPTIPSKEVDGKNFTKGPDSNETDTNKHSVPRKDPQYKVVEPVDNIPIFKASSSSTTSSTSTTSTTTTTTTTTEKPKSASTTTKKPIPKKPLLTEPDDDPMPVEDTKNVSKVSLLDDDSSKGSQVNYVVPIVAVIMSVPLVAMLISFVYKRGTDWYQHRNYRRMDFLIEGMYNS